MNKNKIVILGDSVALRIRPPRKDKADLTYTEHLRAIFPNYIIVNKAIGALPLNKQIKNRDYIIRELPDIFILNYGIVDCSNRPIPYWLFRFINNYDESEGKAHQFIRKFISYIEKKYRKQLVRIRNYRPWTNPQKFRCLYRGLIQQLQKETSARIICIGINRTNERINSQLHRTNERIEEYNHIIKECCDELDCSYIEPKNHIDSLDTPDGIHYDATGHLKIAKILQPIINCYTNG